MATLVNPTTKERVAVQVGSQDAQKRFGSGFVLETKPAAAPTAPVSPTPVSPAPSPVAPAGNGLSSPLASTEVKPGVYDANKLSDFYSKQIESFRPTFDAAQKTLTDVNASINSMAVPDYQKAYGDAYTRDVTPLDTQIQDISGKVNALDTSIRGIEDELRASLGGQAPESIIKAEVARRSQPLLLQRQSLVDQFTTLSSSRTDALDRVKTGLGFQQQGFNDALALSGSKAEAAQSVVDQFNGLLEKGAAASEKEIDNFRQTFTTLLTNSPDVLRNLTDEEYASIEGGFIPASVMKKIGETINEQKLSESKITPAQILTRASQIQTVASANGVVMSTDEAIAQAEAEFRALEGGGSFSGIPGAGGGSASIPGSTGGGGSSGGFIPGSTQGTLANRNNNPGNLRFANQPGATQGQGGFAAFPTAEAGFEALQKDILAKMTGNTRTGLNGNSSIADFFKVYAPASDNNNPTSYANIVANSLNVPVTTKIGTLTGRVGEFAQAIAKHEGYVSGGSSSSSGGPTGTAPSAKQTFEQFIAQKENEAGMSFTPAKRESFRAEYDSQNAGGGEPASVSEFFSPQTDPKYNAKFTPQFYQTTFGQKVLNNEQQSQSAFETKQAIKDFNTVAGNYETISNLIADNPSGAADMAIIFSFMKALDPNSVVREAEYETAAKKTSNVFLGQFAALNSLVNKEGAFLAPTARQAILKALDSTTKAKVNQYNQLANGARKTAEEQGLNPNHVANTFTFTPASINVTNGNTSGGGNADISSLNFKM